ncbi:hypothetical protein HUN08_05035 [Gordonia sp. X0973]|uniref:hypothetical protein n=1 Tax=Gordonia sp. X0973 TaxID=2742602 RepID=UPI000F52BC0E|nr:hypothetical protein [Gordonia sp. X0973]QKT06625.1 hypothetical protein HUN08_05035 [Gordonia sp. X0973]
MLIAAAPRTDRARRHVYGAAVGIVAATTAMAGHCALMPDETPSAGILVMLLIGCAAIGALTSSARPTADRPYTVAAALLVAQVLGHLTLATGSGHAFAAPSPTMVGAHAIALLVGVAVVRRADRRCRPHWPRCTASYGPSRPLRCRWPGRGRWSPPSAPRSSTPARHATTSDAVPR